MSIASEYGGSSLYLQQEGFNVNIPQQISPPYAATPITLVIT